MNQFRSLKIHAKYQARFRRNITIPEIKLQGIWLRELGFTEGDRVRVEQRKNMLIITPSNKPLRRS